MIILYLESYYDGLALVFRTAYQHWEQQYQSTYGGNYQSYLGHVILDLDAMHKKDDLAPLMAV